MDPTLQPKPQRSPWLYVALGCLGLCLVMCLAGGAFVVFAAKKVSDVAQGIMDPATREQNARKMLGELPKGYYAAATLSMLGLMDFALLVDAPPLEDGGMPDATREFLYLRVMGTAQTKDAKAYFTQPEGKDLTDTSALRTGGVNLTWREVLKRGRLNVDGRPLSYVAGRGSLKVGNSAEPLDGVQTALLFECPGEDLHVAVWFMEDPAPDSAASELDLAGTVANEAELTTFLKPVNPCGRK